MLTTPLEGKMVERLTRIDARLHDDAISYGEHWSMAQPLIVVSQLAALRNEHASPTQQRDTAERHQGLSRLLVFALIIGAVLIWFALETFAFEPTASQKAWCARNPTDFLCPSVKSPG